MSCGVVCRLNSNLALLWLWCRAATTAPIQPLAWEPPYAMNATLKKKKKKKDNNNSDNIMDFLKEMKNLGFPPTLHC